MRTQLTHLLVLCSLVLVVVPSSSAHPGQWWWSETFAELHLNADRPAGFDTHQAVTVECIGHGGVAGRYDPEGMGFPVRDRRMEYGPGASSRLSRFSSVKFRHLRCLVIQEYAGASVIRDVNRWGVYELHVTGPGYRSFREPEGPRPFALIRLR